MSNGDCTNTPEMMEVSESEKKKTKCFKKLKTVTIMGEKVAEN